MEGRGRKARQIYRPEVVALQFLTVVRAMILAVIAKGKGSGSD